ncbi:hypothetical protein [Subtercola sp. YIM 133946]|uniref:hypothetical protein n=1 Tax=Subtercola sp. YIM 133946 TaxID=3118909 RepID=UPI002F93F5B0
MVGYDLVGALGVGSTSRVLLVTPQHSPAPERDRVVAKVYDDPADFTRAARTARLWQELDSPHCPQFLDEVPPTVARSRSAPRVSASRVCAPGVIVCSWARHGPLSELLVQRTLRAGEAVTILVPVLQLLAALHGRGEAHGAVDADAIAFDDSGRPVLLGWARGHRHASPLRDVRQFVALCRDVLAATPGDTSASFSTFLSAQLRWIEDTALQGGAVLGGRADSDTRVEGAVGGGGWRGGGEGRDEGGGGAGRRDESEGGAAGGGAAEGRAAGRDEKREGAAGGGEWGGGAEGRREGGRVSAEFYAAAEAALFEVAEPVAIDPLEPFDWNAMGDGALAEVEAEVASSVATARDEARAGARLRASTAAARLRLSSAAAALRETHRVPLWPGAARSVPLRSLAVALLVGAVALTGALLATPSGYATPVDHATGPAASAISAPDGGPAASAMSDPATGPAASATFTPDGGSATAATLTPSTGAAAPGTSAPVTRSGAAGADDGAAASDGAVRGDDPEAALVALEVRREECFAQEAVACFEKVDQAQSSALAADQAAFAEQLRSGAATWRAIVVGAPTGPAAGAGGAAAGAQRVGDAALVAVAVREIGAGGPGAGVPAAEGSAAEGSAAGGSAAEGSAAVGPAAASGVTQKPASALLVKGEAGWRLRAVFAATG